MPPYLRAEKSGELLLRLWVQPGASHSGWSGLHGDRLKVRLGSPPVDGRANQELLRFLSAELRVPARDLELVAGASSRGKLVRIANTSAKQLLARLPKT